MAGRGSSTQKERFGRTFLVAAAGAAGYRVWWPIDDEDRVDAEVRDGGITVDFQLKATTSPLFRGASLVFDLDAGTYNELSGVRNSAAYLLVSVLPDDDIWLDMDCGRTIVHGRTYYYELTGLPTTGNTAQVRLEIPTANLLTECALDAIMQKERRRVVEGWR